MNKFTTSTLLIFIMILMTSYVYSQTIPLKPLFEEFTSSTCAPCASQNLILDALLDENPGTHSLIKYQMNWPGNGDPYYTEEGGVRRDYYTVSGVPKLFINSDSYSPGDITQEIYDLYQENLTAMSIDIITAELADDYTITVSIDIDVEEDYETGLTAHIVVVEKTTVANVGNNGETEFHNVMLKMLPNALGTTLPALSSGITHNIEATYNMANTFMEEPVDLAVIVFVQNDNNKQVIQSEQTDVAGYFDNYSVSINVYDLFGNSLSNASVFLEGNGTLMTDQYGQVTFQEVYPNTYEYQVVYEDVFPAYGSLKLVDQNILVDVEVGNVSFILFEEFETGMPSDWIIHKTSPDNIWVMFEKATFSRATPNFNPIILAAPEVNIGNAERIQFSVGESNNAQFSLGILTDPLDPETFILLETYETTSQWQVYNYDLTETNGADSLVHFAWKLNTTTNCSFCLDNIYLFEDDNEHKGKIEGFVNDSYGVPLINANITVGENASSTGVVGYYQFNDIEQGEWQVICQMEGYYPDTATVIVVEDQWNVQNFELLIITGINDQSVSLFKTYPNPAKNFVNIDFNSPTNSEIQSTIYNSMGNIIMISKESVTIGYNTIELNIQKLPAGTYYYQLTGEKLSLSGRFLKMK